MYQMLFKINKATISSIKARVVFFILTLCGSSLIAASSHKQSPPPTQQVWGQAETPPGQRSLLSISENSFHQCKTRRLYCCTYTENRGGKSQNKLKFKLQSRVLKVYYRQNGCPSKQLHLLLVWSHSPSPKHGPKSSIFAQRAEEHTYRNYSISLQLIYHDYILNRKYTTILT